MKITLATLAMLSMLSQGLAFATSEDDIKATFDRFVAAQNAHDLSAVRELLLDSPNFLWISRGSPIWGREAALQRFETLYQGTWKLAPDIAKLKVISLNETAAQLFAPITFNFAPAGQPAPDTLFQMNQTLVKTAGGWRIASILPIPASSLSSAPSPAPAPAK